MLMVEVVVECGVEGGEFLKCCHGSKKKHRPFSPSKMQVGVLNLVVRKLACFLTMFSIQLSKSHAI